ncbi:Cro/CI family transcriptional regulator [Paraburkholderia unamae]|uniref:DNA-binding transcriptional regulator Cro n=1 Tax=Paraburkholderia unamae TaxID=219649 RepID=A0ABX5KS42_9BURK|nr:Cro/CI family transcriptional regulator [Paraburkholderia unamae]PVX84327.1 DNA-binding transcriptional regulator Cro [Paraburkholderia unamae]
MNLTKQQAADIFGSGAALARALGITKGAVSQWPEQLDQQRTAMVIGAAVQAGKPVPAGFIPSTAATEPAAA